MDQILARPVLFNPSAFHDTESPKPDTPEQRAALALLAGHEPLRLTLDPVSEECQRLDGQEAIGRLVAIHGAKRVMIWVRNHAAIRGEAL